MFVGENEGLGVLIVDSTGRIVARAHGVRMLAPGYSLRHGASGKSYVPPKATANYQKYMTKHPGVQGWDKFGPQSYYQPAGVHGWDKFGPQSYYQPVHGMGQLPMRAVAKDALRSSSAHLSGEGMFGWKYGSQSNYTPGVGQIPAQLPMNTIVKDALRSSTAHLSGEGMFGQQLPMNTVVKDALRSSSGRLSGDDDMEGIADMFGPEGEPSSLF
jgi:hypothetical protein